jgi:hypothetical protein
MILIVRNDSPTLPFRTVLLFFTFLCALLSKESSIGLVALWLLYYSGERGTISLKPAICITLALGLALLIYFTLRNGFFLNADTGITQVMRNDSGPSSLAMETFSAYGFYIRKLFYPFPLTFIITGIDKARYAAFFLALLAPAAVLYHRNRHLRLPLLVIITGLIPPVLALVGRLPFSPYAERYLYLPLTGFALLITLVLKRYLTTVPQVVVVSAILLMAIPTVRRINDWAVPVRFWNKTLQQSPQSPIPHLALTATEIEARNYPAAEQHLENAFAVGMKRDADNQFAREMMRMLKRPTGVGPR